MTNFFKLTRESKEYKIVIASYIALVLFHFFSKSESFHDVLIGLNLAVNVYLLAFLFGVRKPTFLLLKKFKRQHYFIGLFSFIPAHTIATIVTKPNGKIYFIGLLLMCALADIAAWFFGKKFGKNKLWPSVSPKKTVEGAIGGIVVGTLGMTWYWKFFTGMNQGYWSFIFLSLIILAILGDLIQSKIKRRFALKDSSTLIPGHGGIYDRTDSILFAAPFFYLVIS